MSHEHSPVQSPNLLERMRSGAMRYLALGSSAVALGGGAALEASAPAQAIVTTGDVPTTPTPTTPNSMGPAPVGIGDRVVPLKKADEITPITTQRQYDKATKGLKKCSNGKDPIFIHAETGLNPKVWSHVVPGVGRLVLGGIGKGKDQTIKLTLRKGYKFNGGIVHTGDSSFAYRLPKSFKLGKKWTTPYQEGDSRSISTVYTSVCKR